MCENTFPCLLQTGRNTDTESGGSKTFLHGSQFTGGKSQAAMQENAHPSFTGVDQSPTAHTPSEFG